MIASLVLSLSSQPNVTRVALSILLTPLALASIDALVFLAYPPPGTPNVTVDQVLATLVNSSSSSGGFNHRRLAASAAAPSPAPGHFSIILSYHSTLAFPVSSGVPDAANVLSLIVGVAPNVSSVPVSGKKDAGGGVALPLHDRPCLGRRSCTGRRWKRHGDHRSPRNAIAADYAECGDRTASRPRVILGCVG